MYCENCLKFINQPNAKVCPHCGAYVNIDSGEVKKDNRKSFFRNILISAVIIVPVMLVGLLVVFNTYKNLPPEPPERSTDDLPYAIDYNGTDIYYLGSFPYQHYSDRRHIYNLFLVSIFDISALDENQTYWLLDSDMSTTAFLTHEKNGIDFDYMTRLGRLHVTDEGLLYVVYTSSFWNEYRYDFIASDILLHVELALEKDYSPEPGDNSDPYFDVTISAPIPDVEDIPSPLYGYVAKWLEESNEEYSEMFSKLYK